MFVDRNPRDQMALVTICVMNTKGQWWIQDFKNGGSTPTQMHSQALSDSWAQQCCISKENW